VRGKLRDLSVRGFCDLYSVMQKMRDLENSFTDKLCSCSDFSDFFVAGKDALFYKE